MARWRPLIATVVARQFPQLAPQWVEAQVEVESGGNPLAVSNVGAAGLLQLMPGTAREVGCQHVFEPEENLDGGIRYLRMQWDKFPEIHNADDRLRWSWAAYNGGRGFANRALALAREDAIPEWWRWSAASPLLADPRCCIRPAGRNTPLWPDHRQIRDYVERIERAGARRGVRLAS